MKSAIKFVIIFLCFSISAMPDKIKMYALYTPSHEILVHRFFKPSLIDPNIELVLVKVPEQTCQSAQFMNEGWTKTTIQKIELVLRAIDENWGSFFILSDVDIQFFGNFSDMLRQLMRGHDLLIQRDNPKGTLCSGFFICQANEKTRTLFSDVLAHMKNNPDISDQRSLNQHISRNQKNNRYGIVWDYLPEQYFFGGGTFTGVYWDEGVEMHIPKQPVMHHANWVKGVPGKIRQLRHVKKIVKSNQKYIESATSY